MINYFLFVMLSLFSFFTLAAPQWVNNPPTQPGYIIGIGLGEDITKAKQAAMSDLAGTLYANVTSVVSSTARTSGTTGSLETLSTNSMASEDVLLPNIGWEKIESEGGIFYAMAKAKKSEIIDLYESNLNIALKPFSNLLSKNVISLSDYLFVLANQKKLNLSAKRASSISSQSTEAMNHHKNIEIIFTKQNQFVGSTCFNVKKSHDRMADKIYLPSIESAIQSSRFVLNTKAKCIPVKFRSKTDRTGKTVANVFMQIDIGQPAVVSKVIKFEGQSLGSYKSAMIDAADNFSNYFIQNGGLLNSLLNGSGNTIEIGL